MYAKDLAQAVLSAASILPSLNSAVATIKGLTFGLIGLQNAVLQLNGFHFISGAQDHYLAANNHCVLMSEMFIQCMVYAPNTNPARLTGIEYIVTADAFETLPADEKQLWHSHRLEVQSGWYLVQPGLPDGVDDTIMQVQASQANNRRAMLFKDQNHANCHQILGNSYGKTWHTWRYDQKNNSLPVGIPELVNGYTGAGQLTPDFVLARDAEFGINSTLIAGRRARNVNISSVIPGADVWKDGIVLNLTLTNASGPTNSPSEEVSVRGSDCRDS